MPSTLSSTHAPSNTADEVRRTARPQPPPLSLYVHIPWCSRKCPYCDFNSHRSPASLPERDYVTALLADLDHQLDTVGGRTINSIFIGGGTPSLFSADAIGRLLEGVAMRLRVAPQIEITLEANPGSAEQQRFAGYRAAGVNRLSIGIQSFDDRALMALGRIHCAEEAIDAVEAARRAGFDNVNLDLMFGLPGQQRNRALSDLRQAIALAPQHLSWYQLTIEPNTVFARHRPALPADETTAAMHDQGQELLFAHGFRQYEVSAFAQDGRGSVHNLNYWQFGDYLGIGAGAHAKLTCGDGNGIRRSWRIKHPLRYMGRAGDDRALEGACTLGRTDVVAEFMMNALRLNEGVPVSLLEERTGVSAETVQPLLAQARARGLLANDPQRLVATPLGRRFLNDLVGLFVDTETG